MTTTNANDKHGSAQVVVIVFLLCIKTAFVTVDVRMNAGAVLGGLDALFGDVLGDNVMGEVGVVSLQALWWSLSVKCARSHLAWKTRAKSMTAPNPSWR